MNWLDQLEQFLAAYPQTIALTGPSIGALLLAHLNRKKIADKLAEWGDILPPSSPTRAWREQLDPIGATRPHLPEPMKETTPRSLLEDNGFLYLDPRTGVLWQARRLRRSDITRLARQLRGPRRVARQSIYRVYRSALPQAA